MENQSAEVTEKVLGRMPRRSDVRALLFSNFVEPLKQIPAKADFWKPRAPFPLRTFGNTEHGCCTRAKQAIAAMRMERIETRQTPKITDEEVLRVYYDMTSRLYGGGDTGAYEIDALSEWRKPDLTFRDTKGRPLTIDAFLRISASNHDEIRSAIALAGAHGVAVCLNLPWAWSRVEPPLDWDVSSGSLTGEWMPGSWGGHCCAGETPIPLLKGETVPIKDLVGETDLWVYGCLPNNEPIAARAERVERTGRKRVVRVVIDDGSELRTTPEHRFMLRDGSYLPAELLESGTRLMPCRRVSHHRGYEAIKWYDGGRHWKFTHAVVGDTLGLRLGQATHHKDHNKRNNHPSNFEWKPQSEHVREHKPWEQSPLTYAPGWFVTPEAREYLRTKQRNRNSLGQYIPDSENHKVVGVYDDGEWADTYDLINVSPTSNFAAGGVYIHNSMWATAYDEKGIWLEHTWGIKRQRVTWAAAAVYLDEAHLVIDKVNEWKKKDAASKIHFAAIKSEVNAVSSQKML